ncbi:hypothetical protein ACET3X_008556 [Alternaria dauci]|uniref:Uncharacterized protein n=1 Tax=Alternaria dauci TaxID=48095 RepID=A0ABR3UCJ3_9PLEO
MASHDQPIEVEELKRQFFAHCLRPRLEAEFQQQVAIYAQQFGDVSVDHARRIFIENVNAFLRSLQSLSHSSSPSRPYAAPKIALRVAIGAASQDSLQSNLRINPAAILRQALSSPDLLQLLQRRRGTPSKCLPLQHVTICPIVDKARSVGRATRVGMAFEKMIRVAMKTFSYRFSNTRFGKLLTHQYARHMLGLILERECANFGPTSAFADRAHLYKLRLQDLTHYLVKICHCKQDIAEFVHNFCMPTVFDTSHSNMFIRQDNMGISIHAAHSTSTVASPSTVAASASATQIAEPKPDVPRQASATSEFGSDTAPTSQTSVPVASSMDVLQHTKPVQPAQIVTNTHAVSSSFQAQPIQTQVTQLGCDTAPSVNTNEPSAIHAGFPQSDAMEDCTPEPTRGEQVSTTDSQASLPQAMNGVETSYASSHGINTGHDEIDDVQHTNQATVVASTSNIVQSENQNMPDAPPLANVTVGSSGAPSSTTVGETKDQDMPDVPPPVHSTPRLATQSNLASPTTVHMNLPPLATVQPNLAPPTTVATDTKDEDMTDMLQPAQSTLGSGHQVSEAPTITVIPVFVRSERSTSTLPSAPPAFPSSVMQPLAPPPTFSSPFMQTSAASSLSSSTSAESTIQSRAKSKAQSNPHNHWSNGKAHALLLEVPELHRALQQALPNTDGQGPRGQFRNEILDCIDKAESAAELARHIDHAMRNRLLTNAEFNKLTRHAQEGQHARRREAQENTAIQNMDSAPQANKPTGLSQTADDGTAQSGISVPLLRSSQAASDIIAQPTNLSAPPQKGNASGALSSGPPAKTESAASDPQSSREELTRLLIEAQRKMTNKKDHAWSLFAGMFDYSWRNPSDNDVVLDYVIKHPRFQGLDSSNHKRVNIQWTIDIVRNMVADEAPSSCELLVWTCNEALNAQDVKVEIEIPGSYANCKDRQRELGPLFKLISNTNFRLMREVYPSGCLTWDEMKDLAMTQELDYFNGKKPGTYVHT